ncbi:MAG TPA: terminase small subunit [Thermodesulfobacteriota bacterium]|nr:terminase small subunit [Thermodesulfobacteriota bacterium]
MITKPTKYSEETLKTYDEYMAEAIPQNMKIPTVEGFALKLGISKETLYQWRKIHKEISDALRELKMKQKEYLTEIGVFGGKEINSNIVMLLLKVNHKMIESTHTDITSGGKPLPILGDVHKDSGNREAPEANKED